MQQILRTWTRRPLRTSGIRRLKSAECCPVCWEPSKLRALADSLRAATQKLVAGSWKL